MNRDSWTKAEADAYERKLANKYGPGQGRRDHRDDGCFIYLAGPAVVIAAMIALFRRGK